MTATHAITYAIGLNALGAGVAWGLARWRQAAGWFTCLLTLATSALVLYAAGTTLTQGPAPALTLWAWPAAGSAMRFYVDGLSAFFLVLIAGVAALAALFSVGYMRHYPTYGVARYYPHLLLFIAGMYGIVTVTDQMVFFCFFWQLMTLPSYALIRFEFRQPANIRAANKYLLMMQLSCALIMLGAGVLAGAHPVTVAGESLARFDFDALREEVGRLLVQQPGTVTLAFVLLLVGFGIKAGMWPFGQIWLPDAHPAAPSPVSALLSGVMIKTGIYGLLRTFLWLVPAGALPHYAAREWGLVLAVLGTITLFIGTMQALQQEQTKRLLAFHSIGQVGYILLGLGACLALLPAGLQQPAVLALAVIGLYGALFHTLNHGLFKSLLFFNAGSVLFATHTQDLNRLGGLMRLMPLTALTALVASFSIAGVPLFNGFASKWSIYAAAVLGSRSVGWLALCGLVGIVTSALTLASFMKFFGVTFLSRTSKLVAEQAVRTPRLEVGGLMQLPQLTLAALCLALGLLPAVAYGFIAHGLAASAQGLGGLLAAVTPATTGRVTGVQVAGGTALLAPVIFGAVLVALLAFARWISRLGGATRRTSEVWLCGYAREADIHRYGAHNLYTEVKRYFHWVGGAVKPVTKPDGET